MDGATPRSHQIEEKIIIKFQPSFTISITLEIDCAFTNIILILSHS